MVNRPAPGILLGSENKVVNKKRSFQRTQLCREDSRFQKQLGYAPLKVYRK